MPSLPSTISGWLKLSELGLLARRDIKTPGVSPRRAREVPWRPLIASCDSSSEGWWCVASVDPMIIVMGWRIAGPRCPSAQRRPRPVCVCVCVWKLYNPSGGKDSEKQKHFLAKDRENHTTLVLLYCETDTRRACSEASKGQNGVHRSLTKTLEKQALAGAFDLKQEVSTAPRAQGSLTFNQAGASSRTSSLTTRTRSRGRYTPQEEVPDLSTKRSPSLRDTLLKNRKAR